MTSTNKGENAKGINAYLSIIFVEFVTSLLYSMSYEFIIWLHKMHFPGYQLLMQAIEAEIRSHKLGIVADDLVPKYSISDLCC